MNLEEYLEQGLAEWKIPYDGQTLDRFRRYYSMLEETNKVMNLTAIEGEKDTAQLHFLDCAALLNHAALEGKTVADIGTGAGFPGMVLKILCPETRFVLIDSLDKRIRFLQETCEALQLTDITCVHARAEELPQEFREHFDVVTSRAVARLSVLAELCIPYTRQGGQFIAMKGPDCGEEITEAREEAFRESRRQSGTGTEAAPRQPLPREMSAEELATEQLETDKIVAPVERDLLYFLPALPVPAYPWDAAFPQSWH